MTPSINMKIGQNNKLIANTFFFQWRYSPGWASASFKVSSILSSFGRLLSNFYILALLRLPSLRLPTATWVYLLGAFLLAH